MQTSTWQDVGALAPVIVMVLGGSALLLSEVFLGSGKTKSRAYQGVLSAAFAAVAALLSWSMIDDPAASIFAGFGRADGFGYFVSFIISVALALTSLTAQSNLKELASERGEFHAIAHFAAAGMVLLAMSADLLTMFIAIEVMSLGTYALTSYLRSNGRFSEAALKYFMLGSFSSAVFLYGASLAYGAAGSTRLTDIAAAASAGATPLLFASLALLAVGFLFKVAAIPFHMWTPDVYEGAPTPVTGFMAAGVKAAAFAAILRTFFAAYGADSLTGALGAGKGWMTVLGAVAMVTMVGGNLLAIAQSSVKRMLAYSSIAHAGYLLVGVTVGAHENVRTEAIEATLFYLATYAFAAIGAFAIVAILERRDGPESDDDGRWEGLAQRHPVLALAMTVFMLSNAGIPPTAGFMGKLFVFKAALQADAIGLAVVGLLSSLAGLYYYLRVVVSMYMKPSRDGVAEVAPRSTTYTWGLGIAAAATLVAGLLPNTLAAQTKIATLLP